MRRLLFNFAFASLSLLASLAYGDDPDIYILPEVKQLVGKGEWALPSTLHGGAKEAGAEDETPCSKFVSPVENITIPQRFVFPEVRSSVCEEVENTGRKILWNTVSQQWRLKAFAAGFNIFLFPDPQVVRRITGTLQKIFPRAVPEGISLKQLSRTSVQFQTPAPLANYKWLFFNLGTREEDAVWVLSPLAKKMRQITESNLGDPLIPAGPAADDFFVWSGKIEGASISKIESRLMHVPLLKSPEPNRFNFQTGAQKNIGAWFPTNITWEARRMRIVESRIEDPFYTIGYQKIVIDEQSGLPVYKVSYLRDGKLAKVVIGIQGKLAVGVGDEKLDWIYDAMVFDQEHGTRTLVSMSKVESCYGKEECFLKLRDFEPRLPTVISPLTLPHPKPRSMNPALVPGRSRLRLTRPRPELGEKDR